jgi:cytochrome c-type biogenesis protein CcmH/NrfG
MTETIIVVLLAATGSWFAARPVLDPKRFGLNDPADAVRNDAETRKLEMLQAILELESEHAAGVIDRSEFEVLRAERGREALHAIRELDIFRENATDEIEVEIARLRATLCPKCGAPRGEGARCESCGA